MFAQINQSSWATEQRSHIGFLAERERERETIVLGKTSRHDRSGRFIISESLFWYDS